MPAASCRSDLKHGRSTDRGARLSVPFRRSRATWYNSPAMPDPNLLYYGDNLDILRRHVEGESVDLIYLDPPFNSNADYNVLFAEKSG